MNDEYPTTSSNTTNNKLIKPRDEFEKIMARKSSPAPTRRAAPAPARAAPAPAARAPPPPAPAPAQMQTSQPSGGGGMLAGFGATMAQGMALGAGSAIGHQAVNAASNMMFGGGSSHAPAASAVQAQAPVADRPCDMDRTSLNQCLNSSNASNCDFYFTALQNCQANSM